MINKDIIKNCLENIVVTYKIETAEIKDFVADTYFINLKMSTGTVLGGITDARETDDKEIFILFILNNRNKENSTCILNKVNSYNLRCKYGKFYLDDAMDIAFSLSIPLINEREINEEELRFCLNSAISSILDVMEDLSNV